MKVDVEALRDPINGGISRVGIARNQLSIKKAKAWAILKGLELAWNGGTRRVIIKVQFGLQTCLAKEK